MEYEAAPHRVKEISCIKEGLTAILHDNSLHCRDGRISIFSSKATGSFHVFIRPQTRKFGVVSAFYGGAERN